MKLAQVRNEKKNGKIQEKQINYIWLVIIMI
jgi:hypothetical protein